MNYAERIASGTSARPTCFGNSSAYSLTDDECKSCRFQHTCRDQVESARTGYRSQQGFVPVRRVTTPDSPRRREEDDGVWQPGLTKDGESPVARLAKDMFVGALRGASKETYEFFRVFRIK